MTLVRRQDARRGETGVCCDFRRSSVGTPPQPCAVENRARLNTRIKDEAQGEGATLFDL